MPDVIALSEPKSNFDISSAKSGEQFCERTVANPAEIKMRQMLSGFFIKYYIGLLERIPQGKTALLV